MLTNVELDLELLWRTYNALLETFETHDVNKIKERGKDERKCQGGGKGRRRRANPNLFNDIRLCQRCTELMPIVAVHISLLYYFRTSILNYFIR